MFEDNNKNYDFPDLDFCNQKNLFSMLKFNLESSEKKIKILAESKKDPSIENFLMPFEMLMQELSKAFCVLRIRANCHSNSYLQNLEREFFPKISNFYSNVIMDQKIFSKINFLYQKINNLNIDSETKFVITKKWKNFIHNGATLNENNKKRLHYINSRLSFLEIIFNQNILSDNASWIFFLKKKEDLSGLYPDLIQIMKETAEKYGKNNFWAITLNYSMISNFLRFSNRRDLRKFIFQSWKNRGKISKKRNNRLIISEILSLRKEKANLLGFSNYANWSLKNKMAKNPENVKKFLVPIWDSAIEKLKLEKKNLQDFARKKNFHHPIMIWDWSYYSEKLKNSLYNFQEEIVKPYFQLEKMIQAAFWVSYKLFGLTFEEIKIPLWHEDVRIWKVKNTKENTIGFFIGDYFARPTKQSGAWMDTIQSQHKLQKEAYPIVCNVMNFIKCKNKDFPVLLSFDSVCTLFHEFGHALHGILSNVSWPSISGTSVVLDFVEVPSQLYQNWITSPEVLKKFALHYQTNKQIPDEIISKIIQIKNFDSGFKTIQYLSSAFMDIEFHGNEKVNDSEKFEKDIMLKIGIPSYVNMMHYSSHFLHIFANDAYASSYYSYIWSEIFSLDAFSAFKESGNIFNIELAKKLKKYIYSSGGTNDPEILYKNFRNFLPSPKILIKERGLKI